MIQGFRGLGPNTSRMATGKKRMEVERNGEEVREGRGISDY